MTTYSVVATKDAVVSEGMESYAVSRNDGKKGKSGIVCVAPAISDAVASAFYNSAEGKAWLVSGIAGLRSTLISALHAGGKVISDDVIGLSNLLALAKQQTESTRLTKEAIGSWFDADMSKLVSARISERITGISSDKLDKLVAGYRAAFQTLASRDGAMDELLKTQLLKAMELLADDYESLMGGKVFAKLMAAEEPAEVLAAL